MSDFIVDKERDEMRMANLGAVVKKLQTQRNDLQKQMQRLDSALSVLGGLAGAGRGGRRSLSATARKRIADAQRARWAKWKAAHKKK